MRASTRWRPQRESAHPLRSYVELPLLRVLDMWLRPRTEMLNIELRWWQYDRHNAETEFATGYAALNLAYLYWLPGEHGGCGDALPCWWQRSSLYCVLRSLLLATIEAPEARYTVEAFPMLCILAAVVFASRTAREAAAATSG